MAETVTGCPEGPTLDLINIMSRCLAGPTLDYINRVSSCPEGPTLDHFDGVTKCPAGPTLEHLENNFDDMTRDPSGPTLKVVSLRKSEGCLGFLVFLLLSICGEMLVRNLTKIRLLKIA